MEMEMLFAVLAFAVPVLVIWFGVCVLEKIVDKL